MTDPFPTGAEQLEPEALARIHALCFDTSPPPWPAAAFASLCAAPGAVLVAEPCGLALGRVTGEEAELLTLAVVPEARRRGLGRRLLGAFEALAAQRGARVAFLEVAETNAPARALYAAAGYRSAGFRRDYYAAPRGLRVGALVLRKALPAPP